MSSSDLRVSVIIPAFNAAEFLAEAVASVRAQDRAVAEIIVVDDGSTDETANLQKVLAMTSAFSPRPKSGLGDRAKYGHRAAQPATSSPSSTLTICGRQGP